MNREMYTLIPDEACPTCGHSRFIIKDSESNLYLTDNFGNIIDSKEEYHICVGKCLNCGKEYSMLPTKNKFIPLTNLRKYLYEYSNTVLEHDTMYTEEVLPNPLLKEK